MYSPNVHVKVKHAIQKATLVYSTSQAYRQHNKVAECGSLNLAQMGCQAHLSKMILASQLQANILTASVTHKCREKGLYSTTLQLAEC